jgi:hypothetical protein
MTRQGWAERKVAKAATCPDGVNVVYAPTATKLLLAEHRRAVRAVKQEIVATEKLRDTALRADNVAAEAVYLDTIVALNKALAALQKGRT